jgi:calpain-7
MKGKFTIHMESSLPVSLSPLPAEGAGMFCRTISGIWTQDNAGGRPSAGQYGTNPKIEVTLFRDCVIM